MKSKYLRTVLSILGIAGIVAFLLIPNKKIYECLEKDLSFHQYGDSASGIAFAELSPAGFKCELLKENGNCGVGFSFGQSKMDFRNWSLMDSLVLELQGSENLKEVIVQILAFAPEHTDINERHTMKPLLKELKLTPEKKRYSIHMQHFYTPDYWFEQQKVKNRHNPKRFYAIMGLEIFTGWQNKTETPLELKIESICTKGHSNLLFVILICYLATLIIIAISVRTKN
ncbi:MAG: hypothetical protein LBC85_11745 [Fibromonadaceae bacterium]|jgi:hypothetical protein|nr:hypothetical protein [Fibromonadaceae bacterium]